MLGVVSRVLWHKLINIFHTTAVRDKSHFCVYKCSEIGWIKNNREYHGMRHFEGVSSGTKSRQLICLYGHVYKVEDLTCKTYSKSGGKI